MSTRSAIAAAVAAALLGLAGCETAPIYPEPIPEGGALPEPYYGVPPPPVYYGPPVVYYEYRYGWPYWSDPFWRRGPVIVSPPAVVSPPRRQPVPRGGGGGSVIVPPPAPSGPRRQPLPR